MEDYRLIVPARGIAVDGRVTPPHGRRGRPGELSVANRAETVDFPTSPGAVADPQLASSRPERRNVCAQSPRWNRLWTGKSHRPFCSVNGGACVARCVPWRGPVRSLPAPPGQRRASTPGWGVKVAARRSRKSERGIRAPRLRRCSLVTAINKLKRPRAAQIDQRRQRHLRRVGHVCKHGFAEKARPERNAVKTARQRAVVPALDGMRVAQAVQPGVRASHGPGDPRPLAIASRRPGARRDHRREGRVKTDLEYPPLAVFRRLRDR